MRDTPCYTGRRACQPALGGWARSSGLALGAKAEGLGHKRLAKAQADCRIFFTSQPLRVREASLLGYFVGRPAAQVSSLSLTRPR